VRKSLLAMIPLVMVLTSCRTGVEMWAACARDDDPTATDSGYAMVCSGGRWVPIMTNEEFVAAFRGEHVTIAPLPLDRPVARILSASWGTDGAVGCPNGAQGLDNIPVTFNVFIRRDSIQTTDFQITRSDGSVVNPTCALQFPPDESDEAQTVNLIGDFGDAVSGPTPVSISVVGALEGASPGTPRAQPLPSFPAVAVAPLSGGPYIVDAWTLMPSIYGGDRNRCADGTTFVRVMWSNGLTAHPTGDEVGAAVVASYRAVYEVATEPSVTLAPLAVADLHDHSSAANADNMHDLCLPDAPSGARLAAVTIDAGLIQDPNGDPNAAQRFVVPVA
jgi:hypothetical protein